MENQPLALEHLSLISTKPNHLEELAIVKFASFIANQLEAKAKVRKSSFPTRPWLDPSWISFKDWLQSCLPRPVLKKLYEKLFKLFDNTNDILQGCLRNRAMESHLTIPFNIQELPSDLIFVLWWAFIEPFQKNSFFLSTLDLFNSEFHSHLITYLASSKAKFLWQEVTLRFNWILKKDFIKALKNLPHLKYLTLLGSCHAEVIKLMAGKFKLNKLTLTGPLMNMDKGLTPEDFAAFLMSQPELKELDLTAFHSKGFDLTHKVILSALESSPNIKKCVLSRQLCQMLMDQGFQSPLGHIQEIHLLDNSPEPPLLANLSAWISRVFPQVQRMIWREALLHGTDLIHFQTFQPLLTDLRVTLNGHFGSLHEILSQCCHLKRASFDLSGQGSSGSFNTDSIKQQSFHPTLTDISVTCHPCLGFGDLYYLFAKCPKLVNLMLVTERIENLEERPLIEALQDQSLPELECLKLRILEKPFSSNLLFAIVKFVPELMYLKSLALFSFANPIEEIPYLEEMTQKRSLKVVYHDQGPFLLL